MNFFVPGVPRPQGSKRAYVVKGKAVLVESAGAPLKDWRAVVALAGQEAMGNATPFEGALVVWLSFYLPKPKSKPKATRPTTRPDVDKLARSVLDALTHICWTDDAQIVTLFLKKHYAQPNDGYGVGVFINVDVVTKRADAVIELFKALEEPA